MNRASLIRIGAYGGFVFAAVWTICGTGYVLLAGIPVEPPPLEQTIQLMRRTEYRLLFWFWPVAWLAVIPFALGGRAFLARRSPAWATIGSAFWLINATTWFVYNGTILTAFSLAAIDPVDEVLLSYTFSLTGNIATALFLFGTLFQASWAAAYLGSDAPGRGPGWVLLIGAVLTMIYFVMRNTGPLFIAELIHEGFIICWVISVAWISSQMLASEAQHT